jgi:hypothetical protein
MAKTVYLVCGVQGSGKSWVCRQLKQKFEYIPHDRCWWHPNAKPDENVLDPKWGPEGCVSTHVQVVSTEAHKAQKPILTECPFAERKVKEELEFRGIKVIPVFVVESPNVIADRYFSREKKEIPKSAYSRAVSIEERAIEWGAFHGTSDQCLEHLRGVSV